MEEIKEEPMRIYFSCEECEARSLVMLWIEDGVITSRCSDSACGYIQYTPCHMVFQEKDLEEQKGE